MSQKNICLILNASEGILQIIVAQDNLILAHQEWDCPKNATEKLTLYIKDIFEKLAISLQDISKIACVVGAGSFTGIRLCQQTSAALARVFGAKQVAIDFLHALAFNAPTKKGTRTRVITHAKKNLVHCADFIANENNIPVQVMKTVLIEPLKTLAKANSEKQNDFRVQYILGSGLNKIREEEEHDIVFMPESANVLNPRVLLYLAQNSEEVARDIEPEYVRSCDAVDNLEFISTKLGNSPEAAFDKYKEIVKA